MSAPDFARLTVVKRDFRCHYHGARRESPRASQRSTSQTART